MIYLAMTDRFRNGDPSNDSTACKDVHGGDFTGLRASLDYFHEVAATALWITPVNAQTDCGYHGYYIDFTDPADDAIAANLGTPAELAGLVDDLHAHRMLLVLDTIVNHAGEHARIVSQHPGWFHDPSTCSALGDPTIYCPLGGHSKHPDFAQEQPEVAAYLSQTWARLVARYHVDGIRMDTAKHVPPSYFRTSFFPTVRPSFSVAEIWDTADAFPPYLAAGFTSAFHFPLYYALDSAIAKGGSADAIAGAVEEAIHVVGMEHAKDLVLFVDNHDVPRFATAAGAIPPEEIDRRLVLALVLIFTLPGIPQLYYGDELALYGGPDPDNRRDMPAWAFDKAQRAQPHPTEAAGDSSKVFQYAALLALMRRATWALGEGDYHELWRPHGGRNVFAFQRGHDRELRIVVICNEPTPCALSLPVQLPDGTRLEGLNFSDKLYGFDVTVSAGKLPIWLHARSAGIYELTPSPASP